MRYSLDYITHGDWQDSQTKWRCGGVYKFLGLSIYLAEIGYNVSDHSGPAI
jgi:hypothetical protein